MVDNILLALTIFVLVRYISDPIGRWIGLRNWKTILEETKNPQERQRIEGIMKDIREGVPTYRIGHKKGDKPRPDERGGEPLPPEN